MIGERMKNVKAQSQEAGEVLALMGKRCCTRGRFCKSFADMKGSLVGSSKRIRRR